MTQFAFFYFDPMYFVFVGPAFLFAMWAQMRVKSAFARWSEVPTNSRMTGAEVARRICEMGGAEDIPIEISDGYLSDHYDPINRVVRLSQSNYHGSSVAAAAIAAHEAGHAIQHARGDKRLLLRTSLVKFADRAARLSAAAIWLAPIIGLLTRHPMTDSEQSGTELDDLLGRQLLHMDTLS